MNQSRASYSFQIVDSVIAITDHDEGRSVTNDVENVVADFRYGTDLAGYRMIYRDTMGIWDEILICEGRFAGFRSIGEHDLDKALARIKNKAA
jgi:hypothetical protein